MHNNKIKTNSKNGQSQSSKHIANRHALIALIYILLQQQQQQLDANSIAQFN
jgi:hypothetical protein